MGGAMTDRKLRRELSIAWLGGGVTARPGVTIGADRDRIAIPER